MPELPEMQALAERLEAVLAGRALTGVDVLGFSALKTVVPAPTDLLGAEVAAVGRRGKYLLVELAGGRRIVIHLSQAGRLDIERPPKKTRGKGSVVRLWFGAPSVPASPPELAVLVREYGRERKASWWVLEAGDDGPLEKLGPEADSDALAELIRTGTDRRRVHTLLRDQRTVAGVGRGHVDDLLHRAQLSPYATLASLSTEERERLLDALRVTLDDALARERERTGGLSDAKLGDRFVVHGRNGSPCPRCGETLRRVSYDSYEISYCPACQTGGKVLADRRLSRLVK